MPRRARKVPSAPRLQVYIIGNCVTVSPGDIQTGPLEPLIRNVRALPSYERILQTQLAPAVDRLEHDRSPEAQVRAAVIFHMVVEGVIAQAGLHPMQRMLAARGLLPALAQGIELVHRDESRHIAFGVFFLSRLIVAHQNRAYRTFLETMSELKPLTEQFTRELMSVLGEPNPFGIQAAELAEYSQRQFATRTQKIVRARTQTMGDLNREAAETLG